MWYNSAWSILFQSLQNFGLRWFNIGNLVITNFIFLLEKCCSIIGGAIISIGFYGVIWGKAKEEKGGVESNFEGSESSSSSTQTTKMPLLQGHGQNVWQWVTSLFSNKCTLVKF